ncbi:hypothetical protein FLA_6124 [Filimonas lacunae]|nr:hypothetical protein FLA_6124 [Filimonas lacunae]
MIVPANILKEVVNNAFVDNTRPDLQSVKKPEMTDLYTFFVYYRRGPAVIFV